MDEVEAMSVLARELAPYRARPYAALVGLRGQTIHIDTTGPSGTNYQVDIEVMWDGPQNGDLRVMGAIDDGGWRAYSPLIDNFILRSDGTFVDE
jgi:hypothetical protein